MIETKKQAIEKFMALIKTIQKQTDPDRDRKTIRSAVIEERVTDIIDTIIAIAVKEAVTQMKADKHKPDFLPKQFPVDTKISDEIKKLFDEGPLKSKE